jgi:hypothetical protein
MKRVRVIAAALPAAVGLAFPTLAQAAASTHHPELGPTHRVRSDTAGNCLKRNEYRCFSVFGASNYVNEVQLDAWSPRTDANVGYRDVPGYPAKSKWRDSLMNSADFLGWGRKYYPNCSFPTGAHVYGWTSYQPRNAALSFSIHGSTFTGAHKCA